MTITEIKGTNEYTLLVEGRIDTTTSPQLQEKLLITFQKVNNVILDFDKCEFISSAGLRALLIGQKTAQSKRGSMKLINVNEVVMSVFEVTGFDSILTFETKTE